MNKVSQNTLNPVMLSIESRPYTDAPQLGQTQRVLIVEDEHLIREMVTLALEDEGYQVQMAIDGQTALTFLSDPQLQPGEFPFDLIILDLMLPQVNGLDLCRLLRQQGNQIGRAHV